MNSDTSMIFIDFCRGISLFEVYGNKSVVVPLRVSDNGLKQ